MASALSRAFTSGPPLSGRHARACTFRTVPDQDRSWCRFAGVISEPRDVLVVGDLNPDLLVSGDDVMPRFGQRERYASIYMTLGGSAGIFAAGAAGLGLRAARGAVLRDDPVGGGGLGRARPAGRGA